MSSHPKSLKDVLREAEDAGIAVQLGPAGINLVFTIDDLIEWVLKPMREGGVPVDVSVDYAKRTVKIHIPIEYVRGMLRNVSPKDYEMLKQLLGFDLG